MTLDAGESTRTGGEIIVDFLVGTGVRHVFGIELNVHNMVPIQGVVPAPGRGAAIKAR